MVNVIQIPCKNETSFVQVRPSDEAKVSMKQMSDPGGTNLRVNSTDLALSY